MGLVKKKKEEIKFKIYGNNGLSIRKFTNDGVDFAGTAYSPCAIISPDPYHQFVPSLSRHLVEELQALLVSVGVDDTRLQQGTVANCTRGCVELHEVASIWKEKQ